MADDQEVARDIAVALGAWRCYVCEKVCGVGYLGADGICSEACAVVWVDSQNKMIERLADREARDVARVLGAVDCVRCGQLMSRGGELLDRTRPWKGIVNELQCMERDMMCDPCKERAAGHDRP